MSAWERGRAGELPDASSGKRGPEEGAVALKPEDAPEARRFFRQRTALIVGLAAGLVVVCALCGAYTGFDLAGTVADAPEALAWLVVNFTPDAESFEKTGQIMRALLSTVMASVSASTIAAVLAYVSAVIGSSSVGLGSGVSLVVRGVALVFRNIPVVAWAFILLFSFHQSEFTGFLALFLGSYGYLTRCFLENIDEVSGGPVEALRATGASYPELIAQAVLPLTLTSVVSWTLYMVETNIRDATLVGILTGTGVGFVFSLYYRSFEYGDAGLVIAAVVIVVLACEGASNFVRRRII